MTDQWEKQEVSECLTPGDWNECLSCGQVWDKNEREDCPGCECDCKEIPPPPTYLDECNAAIRRTAQRIGEFLVLKNSSYQNAIFQPAGIFGKTTPLENVHSRIDEKLKRITGGKAYPGDDDALDLLGYLILREAIKEIKRTPAKGK